MKIAFIEPRQPGENVYSKLRIPLLGPLYLGTILKNRGHEVEVYNEDFNPPDYDRLQSADVVGISILTSTSQRGYEVARKFPREKVVLGGVHASLLPEEAIRHARQVVVGEAEDVIADVFEGRLKDRIVQGTPVQDLDSLPYPDFSLLTGLKKSLFVTPISTSRGCPFDCSFCSVTKMFGRAYRFRSPENVIGELLSSKKKSFFICDDNFTANPARSEALLKLMEQHRIRDWSCQVRCDVAKNKDVLELMRKAGCVTVCIGMESINQKTLEAYDKKQTVSQIAQAIQSFHEFRIKVHGMFVLGGDDDSAATVWDTVKFAIKKKIDTLQISILTPFPGTKVYEDLEKEKRIFTKDWTLYDGHHIVYHPKLMSAKELQLNVIKAYARFYSLARTILSVASLKTRNAFFNFMGYLIVRKWKRDNPSLSWLEHRRHVKPLEAVAGRM
jgi:radical SAM superfamily enzyme YgiQ (UPF0313 family)